MGVSGLTGLRSYANLHAAGTPGWRGQGEGALVSKILFWASEDELKTGECQFVTM